LDYNSNQKWIILFKISFVSSDLPPSQIRAFRSPFGDQPVNPLKMWNGTKCKILHPNVFFRKTIRMRFKIFGLTTFVISNIKLFWTDFVECRIPEPFLLFYVVNVAETVTKQNVLEIKANQFSSKPVSWKTVYGWLCINANAGEMIFDEFLRLVVKRCVASQKDLCPFKCEMCIHWRQCSTIL
jgi:hypothetical protein